MQKTFQMPIDFVTDVYKLVALLENQWPDKNIESLCHTIESQIRLKVDAMNRRESFTAYKMSGIGTDERERHRKEYLNLSGMSKDWRTEKESSL